MIRIALDRRFLPQVTEAYKRFKYWFQEEDLTEVPENSAVVVAVFRDPYDWVEAMRIEPLHAHDHLHLSEVEGGWYARPLGWKEFVTKPWIGRRGEADRTTGRTNRGMNGARCADSYSFYDAVPCSAEDSSSVEGLGEYKYEYRRDRSERGFSSIVDLRREKILNHLSVADFRGTRAFLPFRFEDANDDGVLALIRSLEEATGTKAKCDATPDFASDERNNTDIEELRADYVEWMDRFVDWDVESLIGYSRRGGGDSSRRDVIETEQDSATPTAAIEPSSPTEPVEQIILLGERHSGTNWITDHLAECFDVKVSVWRRYLFKFVFVGD